MKILRTALILALLPLMFGLACKSHSELAAEVAYAPRLGAEVESDCSRMKQLRPTEDSTVSWEATKVKSATGEEIRMQGRNKVDGVWRVEGDNLLKSTGEFTFDAASTDSSDQLRDDRIKYVIFGLARIAPFRFSIDALEIAKGASAKLPHSSSIEVQARGVLEINGSRSIVRFPLIVKEQGDRFTVTPKGLVLLNIRQSQGKGNGIDLRSRLEQILTYVSGISLKDQVSIDFNISLKNTCRNS